MPPAMLGNTANMLVSRGKQVVREAWRYAGKAFKHPKKQPLQPVSRQPQLDCQAGWFRRLACQRQEDSLARQMFHRFRHTQLSGSHQLYGSFQGLRRTVAFGLVGALTLQQADLHEERHETVFDDIRGMFEKHQPPSPCQPDIHLASFEFGSHLSAAGTVAVFEAKIRDDDDEGIAVVEEETQDAGVEVESNAAVQSAVCEAVSQAEITHQARSLDTVRCIEAGVQCNLIHAEPLHMLNQASSSEDHTSFVYGMLDESFECIADDEIEDLPPLEFDCSRSCVSDSHEITCRCESGAESCEELYQITSEAGFVLGNDVAAMISHEDSMSVCTDCPDSESDIDVLSVGDWDDVLDDDCSAALMIPLPPVQDLLAMFRLPVHEGPPPDKPPDSNPVSDNHQLAIKMLTGHNEVDGLLNELQQELLPCTPLQCVQSGVKPGGLGPHANIVEQYGGWVESVPWLSLDMLDTNPHLVPPRITADAPRNNHAAFIVMKRYTCSLRDYLSTSAPGTWTGTLLLTQLLEAVQHMHTHGVAHRLIDSSHMLVELDPDGLPHLVVTSFRHAIQCGDQRDFIYDLQDVVKISEEIFQRGMPAAVTRLMTKLTDWDESEVATTEQTVLTGLHLLLWKPSDLDLSVKVMPWIFSVVTSVLLQARKQAMRQSESVTFMLHSLFVSKLSKECTDKAINILLSC